MIHTHRRTYWNRHLDNHQQHPRSRKDSLVLTIGALGVVYGDIGTSPLYAMREVFFGHTHLERTEAHVLGALSLFFWSLTLVVSVKYLVMIMRADNRGEGGVFALLALIKERTTTPNDRVRIFAAAALVFGACLLYADGLITPAISVLSAVEGIEVLTPALKQAVVPITVFILFCLFFIQRRGTEKIGRLFGPVMIMWFTVLTVMAVPYIGRHPEIMGALNPLCGLSFLYEQHITQSMVIMGSVVLCVTGGEALYADMGHFGIGPIRVAWFGMVYPALVINYFGQGAFLLDGSLSAGETNLFYLMTPDWALIPMVVLATAATIIASQALIAGAYSLTQQAIGLGFLPRQKIVHTSASMHGQIYMPTVNWLLFAGCVGVVLGFRSSSALAAAYGITVTATMAITTMGFYVVATRKWAWRRTIILPVCIIFTTIDLTYFVSNAMKFIDGGFVPVVIGLFLYGIMKLWEWGKIHLSTVYFPEGLTVDDLLALKDIQWKDRIPRRICFFSGSPVRSGDSLIPLTLQTFVSRLHVLPAELAFVTVLIENHPYVDDAERVEKYVIRPDVMSLILHYGYMEDPRLFGVLQEQGIKGNIVVGDHEIISDHSSARHDFLVRIFRNMLRLSLPTYRYFGLRGQTNIMKEVIPVEITRDQAVLLEVDY